MIYGLPACSLWLLCSGLFVPSLRGPGGCRVEDLQDEKWDVQKKTQPKCRPVPFLSGTSEAIGPLCRRCLFPHLAIYPTDMLAPWQMDPAPSPDMCPAGLLPLSVTLLY